MYQYLRIVWVIWLVGFLGLALVATSTALFAPSGTPARFHSWLLRMFMAAVWPVALFSRQGREAMRLGFRNKGN